MQCIQSQKDERKQPLIITMLPWSLKQGVVSKLAKRSTTVVNQNPIINRRVLCDTVVLANRLVCCFFFLKGEISILKKDSQT